MESGGSVVTVSVLIVVLFAEYLPGVAVVFLLGPARLYSICYLCFSEDGVGNWTVSCITAINRPDGSFVCGFLSSKVLAALA